MNQATPMFKVWKTRSQFSHYCYYTNFAVAALLALNLTVEGFKSRAAWKWPGVIAVVTLLLEYLVDSGFCMAMMWLGEPKIHYTFIHDLLVVFFLVLLLAQHQSAWASVALIKACTSGIVIYCSPYIGCVTALYAIGAAVLALLRSKFSKITAVSILAVIILIGNACVHPALFGIINWSGKRYWDIEMPVHVLVLAVALPLFIELKPSK